MRAVYFLWAGLAVGTVVPVFLLKYKVQALEDELIARQEQVIRDQAAIRVLQAEWTYLNDPERLRRLSTEHLGFAPATARSIAEMSALPFRSAGQERDPQAGATPPSVIQALPRIETRLRPDQFPAAPGIGAQILARVQQLLVPSSAGAATMPSVPAPRAHEGAAP